jgi:hypothetical protein
MGDRPPPGGFVTSVECGLRTIVYVDGYNLYYGLLRKSKLKWLDLYQLFNEHVLDDRANLLQVRYYTAPVLGRMSDDSRSTQRQRTYLQALRKMYPEKLEIIEGKILATTPFQRLVQQIPEVPHIRLGLIAPILGEDHRHISKDLSKNADWSKILSLVHLKNSQLPERIPSSRVCKPDTW